MPYSSSFLHHEEGIASTLEGVGVHGRQVRACGRAAHNGLCFQRIPNTYSKFPNPDHVKVPQADAVKSEHAFDLILLRVPKSYKISWVVFKYMLFRGILGFSCAVVGYE